SSLVRKFFCSRLSAVACEQVFRRHPRHRTAWAQAEPPAPAALPLPAPPLLLPLLLLRSLLLANRRRRRCHQIHPSRHLVKRGFLQSSLLLLISGCASRWDITQAPRMLGK